MGEGGRGEGEKMEERERKKEYNKLANKPQCRLNFSPTGSCRMFLNQIWLLIINSIVCYHVMVLLLQQDFKYPSKGKTCMLLIPSYVGTG